MDDDQKCVDLVPALWARLWLGDLQRERMRIENARLRVALASDKEDLRAERTRNAARRLGPLVLDVVEASEVRRLDGAAPEPYRTKPAPGRRARKKR